VTAGPDVAASRERCRPMVGAQIRRLRRDRALTLADVAERSGLNVGYLSQVENDKASPSLETLASLGQALDVPITWFLAAAAPPPRVVRASERRSWSGPGGGDVQEVDGGIPRDLCTVLVTMPAGMSTGLHAHAGDEHHVLLRGRLRMVQGDHEVELEPGDYLVWDATIPHDAVSIGGEAAEVLIVSHRTHGAETSRPDGSSRAVGE
jgi:transcriptional regulator with XRE-family HTH domain